MDPMRSIHWQKIKYKLFKYKFLSIMYSLYANIVRSISFSTPHTKVLVQTLCLAHLFHSKSSTGDETRKRSIVRRISIRQKNWTRWEFDENLLFWPFDDETEKRIIDTNFEKRLPMPGGGGGNNFRHNFCGASFGQVVSLLYLSGCTLGLS